MNLRRSNHPGDGPAQYLLILHHEDTGGVPAQ
jgi:hypothetical protein